MRFRTRLLAASLATLALGLGLLLVLGNLLLAGTVDGDTSRLLETRADAQIAALTVTPAGVRVRHAVNDDTLDAHAWIFDRGRLIERPTGVPAGLDRIALSLGAGAVRHDTDGPGDARLRTVPLFAGPSHRVVGAIVVEVSTAPFRDLKRKVLVGSVAIALLILLGGAIAVGRALHGALDPVRRMTTDAEDWGEHDLDRRFALGPARMRSPVSPRPSTICSSGSRPPDATSAISPRTSPTSCARRSLPSAAGWNSRSIPALLRPLTRRCARSRLRWRE
jgi:hypothetical protein